ncbi:hypothetical protein [Hymenobacter tenuis]
MTPFLSFFDLLIRIGKGDSVILLGILWGFNTQLPAALRPLRWYIFWDALLYVLGVYGSRMHRNNVPTFHFSTLCDVTCLALIYLHLSPKKDKKLLIIGWLLFIVSAIISAIWTDGLVTNINTLSRFIGNSFLVFIALRHMMSLAITTPTLRPLHNPEIVLSSMVVIYYSCTTLVIIAQDLPRYALLPQFSLLSKMYTPSHTFATLSLLPYPFLRAIRLGLLIYLINLFPLGVRPRRALPRWLRFRVGWRPPTEPPQYRILPAHLVR